MSLKDSSIIIKITSSNLFLFLRHVKKKRKANLILSSNFYLSHYFKFSSSYYANMLKKKKKKRAGSVLTYGCKLTQLLPAGEADQPSGPTPEIDGQDTFFLCGRAPQTRLTPFVLSGKRNTTTAESDQVVVALRF